MKNKIRLFVGAFLFALMVVSVPVVAQAAPASVDHNNPIAETLDVVGQWWNQILVAVGFGHDNGPGTRSLPPSEMVPGDGELLTTERLIGDANDTDAAPVIEPNG